MRFSRVGAPALCAAAFLAGPIAAFAQYPAAEFADSGAYAAPYQPAAASYPAYSAAPQQVVMSHRHRRAPQAAAPYAPAYPQGMGYPAPYGDCNPYCAPIGYGDPLFERCPNGSCRDNRRSWRHCWLKTCYNPIPAYALPNYGYHPTSWRQIDNGGAPSTGPFAGDYSLPMEQIPQGAPTPAPAAQPPEAPPSEVPTYEQNTPPVTRPAPAPAEPDLPEVEPGLAPVPQRDQFPEPDRRPAPAEPPAEPPKPAIDGDEPQAFLPPTVAPEEADDSPEGELETAPPTAQSNDGSPNHREADDAAGPEPGEAPDNARPERELPQRELPQRELQEPANKRPLDPEPIDPQASAYDESAEFLPPVRSTQPVTRRRSVQPTGFEESTPAGAGRQTGLPSVTAPTSAPVRPVRAQGGAEWTSPVGKSRRADSAAARSSRAVGTQSGERGAQSPRD